MSILGPVQGLPGMKAAITSAHRIVTRGGWIPSILPQGKTLAGDCSRDPGNSPDITRLRAGLLLGKIATVVNSLGSVGYYAPSIIDTTANAQAPGDTTITLTAAGATELSRRCGSTGTFVLRGPAAAGGPVGYETVTYSAVNTSTGAVTVTAILNNYIAGSFVSSTDGTDQPITFIPNGYPIMATDFDGTTNLAQPFGEVPVDCIVDSSQLLPVWPTDTSLQAWIVSRLSNSGGGKFIFSHVY